MGNLFSYYTKIIFLTVVIINHLWEIYLAKRQMIFLDKNRLFIPFILKDIITDQDQHKAVLYSQEKLKLSIFKIIYSLSLFLYWFPFRGAENLYLKVSNLSMTGDIIFLIIFSLVQSFLLLPLKWYKTFSIDSRFGFNNSSKSTFIKDVIKNSLMSLAISAVIVFSIIQLMNTFKNSWWILGFLFILVMQLLIIYIYPKYISPLFNKFTPLPESSIKEEIQKLLSNHGIISQEVLVMDASRRTNQVNAYFTGFGKYKKIVIYDTLLNNLKDDELLGVIAHELGHLKLNHIPKMLVRNITSLFLGFIFIFLLSNQEWFYSGHFIRINTPGTLLFLATYALSSYIFFIAPISSYLSRKYEYEADAFAIKNTNKESYIRALKKVYQMNSSPVLNDNLYELFYSSHPSISKRIERMAE